MLSLNNFVKLIYYCGSLIRLLNKKLHITIRGGLFNGETDIKLASRFR